MPLLNGLPTAPSAKWSTFAPQQVLELIAHAQAVVLDRFGVASQTSPRAAGLYKLVQASLVKSQLAALSIEIICANSPQAKGRVERANGTLQDRLVKAMRLDGISTIAEANAFLPGYMARHNQRFAKVPFDPRDVHRPLAPHDDLKAEMVWREQRTVTQALTLHYNKAMIILEPTEVSRPLAGKRVDVCEYPDGRLEIRHEEHVLPYRVFDKIRQVNQAAIVENKHLDAALAMAKAMQEMLPPRKRNNNEPCRRSQGANMFRPPQPQEGAPVKRKRGRPPLPRLSPIEAAQRMLEPV